MKILSLVIFFSIIFKHGIAQDVLEKNPLSLFSKENLKNYVNILGHDSLSGRGTGTPQEEITANFISKKYWEFGLEPVGNKNSYFQFIPLHGSKPLDFCKLKLHNKNGVSELKLGDDYLLYTSGEQTFLASSAPLIFVGYGIFAPEFDYNDYQQIEVEGKIVVFLEGEPFSEDPRYFNGHTPTIYSLPEAKQRTALARGAVGSILLLQENDFSDQRWNTLQNEFLFENVTLASSVNSNLSILINPKAAKKLFDNSKHSIGDIYSMHSENRMSSFELHCELEFNGSFSERDFLSRNVIGVLYGTDEKLKDDYLIISAHYDHLGIGPKVNGDSIYNGVHDNAIGVAGLLEIIRTLSRNNVKLKRSILFLCLTAEEKGLLGSQYYVSSPLVPLYKCIANVNIDGLAAFDEFNSIIGIGSEYSSLSVILKKILERRDVGLSSIPSEFENWISFYKSDQAAFAQAGVPSILVYEGIDPKNQKRQDALNWYMNYSTKIYHTPFDDTDQIINYNATVQHLTILYDLIIELANSDSVPEWNDDSPFLLARLRSIAENR
ncbi:MAG: M20/M25/M40 family metallo-hydrolase [Ignavibacteriaceae bacterium]|nr:M20/M25/M40 family metallo-hydrolase [Ignavibacteriaceae bacterium]